MNPKNLFPFLPILLLCLGFAPTRYDRVKFVYDGDTILLETRGKVRYLGVDAPETAHGEREEEFMAIPSKDFNRALVQNKRVRLEFDRETRDRHGRLLAYVFLEDGRMVNALLLRQGYARMMVTNPNLKYFSRLLMAQRQAMMEKVGVWGEVGVEEERYYLGSRRSYRFHRPGCAFARQIRPGNLVRFKDRFSAFWQGYSPCKRCRP